jgi:hypothetical protein
VKIASPEWLDMLTETRKWSQVAYEKIYDVVECPKSGKD